MHRSLTCAAMVVAVAAVGCSTTSTTSYGWGETPFPTTGRTGRVVWIQETTQRREGHAGASAVAGAVIGGIIGYALSGSPGGVLVGAAEGALVGTEATPRTTASVSYLVVVQFDDGNSRSFAYEGWPPFQINQVVQESGQGLVAR